MTRLLRTYCRTFLTNKPLVRVFGCHFPALCLALTEQHQTVVSPNLKLEAEKGLLSFFHMHTLNAPLPASSALHRKIGHQISSTPGHNALREQIQSEITPESRPAVRGRSVHVTIFCPFYSCLFVCGFA